MMHNDYKQNEILRRMSWINSASGAKDEQAFIHDSEQLMYKFIIMGSVKIVGYDALSEEEQNNILRLVSRSLQYYCGLDHVYHLAEGRLLVIRHSSNISRFAQTMHDFIEEARSFTHEGKAFKAHLEAGYIYGCPVEKDDIDKMMTICRELASPDVRGADYLDYDYISIDHADKFYLTSRVDDVTGLLNKSAFLELSEKALNNLYENNEVKEKSIAVAYVNLLNFKLFNDKYGYSKGNQLLKDLAGILREMYPHAFVSRFESDHFYIVTRTRQFEEDMKNIEENLKDYSRNVAIDVRAGICFLPVTGFTHMIHYCDNAKISADRIRHANVSLRYFKDTFEGEAVREKYIVENFMTALKEGWIKLYFQPVVRTINGRVCSMEVLARWDDPRYGLLPPGVFIGVLEEYHLIHHLDTYIIRKICQSYYERVKKGEKVVPLSFNLSRLDFELSPIFDIIQENVRKYDIPTSALNIEITESMMAHNTDFMKEQVRRIHEAGYKVWMDDFGSEYSSLNTLKDFEFDELKIDMKFLSKFNLRSRRIIASIVDMAKKLGIQTLAEGVETKDQYQFLKGIGCEKVQGYYFSRPLPFDELATHLKNNYLAFEDPAQAPLYDALGTVNMLSAHPLGQKTDDYETEQPLAEFIVRDHEISCVSANDMFLKTLKSFEIDDMKAFEVLINKENVDIVRRIKDIFRHQKDPESIMDLDFSYNDDPGLLEMKRIYHDERQSAFLIHLENIKVRLKDHQKRRAFVADAKE